VPPANGSTTSDILDSEIATAGDIVGSSSAALWAYIRTDGSDSTSRRKATPALFDSDDEADFAWMEESGSSVMHPKPLEARSESSTDSTLSHITVRYPTPAMSLGSGKGSIGAEHRAPEIHVKNEVIPPSSPRPFSGPPVPFLRTAFGLPLAVGVCGENPPLSKYKLLIEVSLSLCSVAQFADHRC